jgi:hypothetical protein
MSERSPLGPMTLPDTPWFPKKISGCPSSSTTRSWRFLAASYVDRSAWNGAARTPWLAMSSLESDSAAVLDESEA